jgi:hypothetical protein
VGKLKILFCTYPDVDYGLDTLYDGLCRNLGSENVFEYPHKPSLHSVRAKMYSWFPMFFEYPINAIDQRKLWMLENDLFDVILVSIRVFDEKFIEVLKEKSKKIPVILIDQNDHRILFDRFLTELNARLYFKREYLDYENYNPTVQPLSLSYSEKYIPENVRNDRTYNIFWIGAVYGSRHKLLRVCRKIAKEPSLLLNCDQRTRLCTQEDYRKQLLSSRIGLNFRGYGYDSVRYYEIPAHATLLFTQKFPIVIENNYTDGVNAVFFSDYEELKEKLKFCQDNESYVDRLRFKGYEHFIKYHTTKARAKQMFDKIRKVI